MNDTECSPNGPERQAVSPLPIAVIIVCRNAMPALQRTVESVRALADSRVLPILIDGASTDGTDAWLANLGNWAFHARSEPDRGIYDAMNKGWAKAPDDAFILYLGAGDIVHELPDDASLRNEAGQPLPLVLGDTHVGAVPFESRWRHELRLRNTAHHQAMMVFKRLSPQPPFDSRLRLYADWDFNLRLFRDGVRAKYVGGLRTYAAPGGASWSMDIAEIHQIAKRHSGRLVGAASWLLNSVSSWRRRRDVSAARSAVES